jgi:cytoskeletal protein CcmA (bactofilin family)
VASAAKMLPVSRPAAPTKLLWRGTTGRRYRCLIVSLFTEKSLAYLSTGQRLALAETNSRYRGWERQLTYFNQKAGRENSPINGMSTPVKMPERPMVTKTSTDTVSTLGAGMVITGNIVCEGSAQIFGRVIGDIQAVQILIGDGAHVEGNITAHEVGINGEFKGTIRAHNVKLKGAAVIDGEVFSKSLSVEENVQFEGLSRRLEKPIELASGAPGGGDRPVLVATGNPGSFSQTGV